MNRFLEFEDKSLKEEYKKHIHHEVIICRKQFLFFFYCWSILDFAVTNFLAFETDTLYNYFDAVYSLVELVVKISCIMFGFRYFLRSHKRFVYVDYFFIVAYAAYSVYAILKILSYDMDELWIGFQITFLLIVQILTIRRGKFRTIYFILFSCSFAGYCIYRQQGSYAVYCVDLAFVIVLYTALNYTLDLSFKQNFMEKYSVSMQENVWEKIMNILPEGTLIVDGQNRAHFCNPAFIKLIDIDEHSSESLYDSLYRVKEVKLRPDGPDLRTRSVSAVQPSLPRGISLTNNRSSPQLENRISSQIPGEFEPMKFKHPEHEGAANHEGDLEDDDEDLESSEHRSYENLKTLVKLLLDNMAEYKERGVGWDTENHEPKFFIADASLGDRNLEIKIGYSPFNESKTIILIFTDTTQSYKVARLQDNDNFKSTLLASISHELRTPLNGTISLIEVAISSGKVTPEIIKDLLLPALCSTKRLEYFVKDVSDFNDLHQDKFGLAIESWEIRPIIDEVVKLIRIPAESKGLEMKLNISEEVPIRVSTDSDRMCQILVNLLSNSLRFTNQGKITLSVSLDKTDPNTLIFDVIDTGVGMSEADKDRLLNLMDSGKLGKVSQSSTGASLGISISNALSHRLGRGLKLLESEPKKGSHFQFTITNQRDAPISGIITSSALSLTSRKKRARETRINQYNQAILRKTGELDLNPSNPSENAISVGLDGKNTIDLQQEDSAKRMRAVINEGDIENEELNEDYNPGENGLTAKIRQHLSNRLGTPIGSKRVFEGATIELPPKKRPTSSNSQTKKQSNQITPLSLPPIVNRLGGWMDDSECSCPEIIVVDDEQINHIAMEWILRKLNIKFEAALNGIEALKLVTRLEQKKCGCRGIKFMLLDLGMPEMDGYETAARLKDMMIKNEIKGFFMIACTAYVGDDVKKKCVRSGFDDFVNKPLTIDKVSKMQQKYSKKHMRPNFFG